VLSGALLCCCCCCCQQQVASINQPAAACMASAPAHYIAVAVPISRGSHASNSLILLCHSCVTSTGDKTFTNHSTGTATRLGPWGYSYTPAGQVHSAEYHADTVFYIGFEGELQQR
jgi:hypothetical protein